MTMTTVHVGPFATTLASKAPPRIIVLMGVSGCGKTTTGKRLAMALGWPFRDADSFHPQANIAKMASGRALDDDDRAPWLAAIAAWIDTQRASNESGIVSCSALKRRYRDVLIGGRTDVRLVYLMGSLALIGDRLSRRKGHFMPPALLRSQFQALEAPTADELALAVSIRWPPKRIVAEIISECALHPVRRIMT